MASKKSRIDNVPGKAWIREVQEICTQKNLQFTPLRQAIVGILADLDKPAGAYEIMDRLAKMKEKTVAPTTV